MQQYLTINEAAQRLRVSRATIYRLIESGKIKAVKVASKYRIGEQDLEEAVRSGALSQE